MQATELEHTRQERLESHKKRVLVLRHMLIGRGWYEALSALEFSRKHTVGYRKDNVTPNFDHPVSIGLYLMTFPDLLYPQEAVALAMTHDLIEDSQLSELEVRAAFRDGEFGLRVGRATDLLSKESRGVRRDDKALFEAMAECPIASIGKPADRAINQNDMAGVFTREKIEKQVWETEDLILPMLKRAKRNFPQQTLAYENMNWTLKSQVNIVKGLLRLPEPEPAANFAP